MKFNELVMTVEADISDSEEDVSIPPGYDDRLGGGRFTIFIKSPFLGTFLRKLAVVTTFDVDTMAVSDTGNIYINPKFAMGLTFNEFVGVLAHEAMHIVNFTFRRRRGRQFKLWNISTDFIMNRDLLDSGFELPAEGCLPIRDRGMFIVRVIDKRGYIMEIDITNSSAEELYKILKDNLPIEEGDDGEVRGKIKGEGEGEGEGAGGEGEGTGGVLSTVDDHISDAEEDAITPADGSTAKKNTLEELKRTVSQALQESKADVRKTSSTGSDNIAGQIHGSGVGKGSAKANINLQAEKLIKPEVNWRVVLRDIVTKSSVVRTMSRPSKRTYGGGAYMPRKKRENALGFCCLAMDTSGSVPRNLIRQFADEIVALTRQFSKVSVLVCLWTDRVYYAAMIDKNSASHLVADIEKAYNTGGTNLSNVAKWLQSSTYNKDVRAVIYLTDGWLDGNDKYIMPLPVQSFALIPAMGGGELNIPRMKVFNINTNV